MKRLHNFYKAIIKKLNNFRLVSVIASIVSLVAGIVSLGLLFIYYFAGEVSQRTLSQQPSFVNLGISGKVLGMIFFLAMIFVIGLSIAVIYNLLPFVKNKEKLTPKKLPLILAAVSGGFGFIVFVFSILAITLETPNTLVLYIVTLPFTFLTSVANLLLIVPTVKCAFYQPAIGAKLHEKKEAPKEVEAK